MAKRYFLSGDRFIYATKFTRINQTRVCVKAVMLPLTSKSNLLFFMQSLSTNQHSCLAENVLFYYF